MEDTLSIRENHDDRHNFSVYSPKIKAILEIFNNYKEENYIELQPLLTSLTAEEVRSINYFYR